MSNNVFNIRHPLGFIEGLLGRTDVQLALTGLMIGTGGAVGLLGGGVVKGLGGAQMGIFAGTEVPNLVNMKKLGSSELADLGAKIGDQDANLINQILDQYDVLAKDYGMKVGAGDIYGAEVDAQRMKELGKQYAGIVKDHYPELVLDGSYESHALAAAEMWYNGYGFQFSDSDAIPGNYTTWSIPDFDPNSKVTVNGSVIRSPYGNSLKLPPGKWSIQVTTSRYGTKDYGVLVGQDGQWQYTNVGRVTQQPVTPQQPSSTTPPGTPTTEDTVRAQDFKAALDRGFHISGVLPSGWSFYDPGTGAWKNTLDFTSHTPGNNWLTLKDAEGNIRQTSFNITEVTPTEIDLGHIDYIPYMQEPYQQTDTTTRPDLAAKGQSGLTWYGLNPNWQYFVNGVEIKDPERSVATNVSSGMVQLRVVDPETGYVGTKEIFVKPGEVTSIGSWMDPEPNAFQYAYDYEAGRAAGKRDFGDLGKGFGSGGGGGGGGGGSSSGGAPADNVGYITFGATCAGSNMWLDDVQVAPVIGEVYELAQGYHSVVAEKTGYAPWRKTVYIPAGETVTVSPAFEPLSSSGSSSGGSGSGSGSGSASKVYRANFNSEPAGAKVLINEAWTGLWTPCYVDLSEGLYNISIMKTGYDTETYPLYVGEVCYVGYEQVQAAIQAGLI